MALLTQAGCPFAIAFAAAGGCLSRSLDARLSGAGVSHHYLAFVTLAFTTLVFLVLRNEQC